jgi:hypothetical protein
MMRRKGDFVIASRPDRFKALDEMHAKSDAEWAERERQRLAAWAQYYRDLETARQYEAFRARIKSIEHQAQTEIDSLVGRVVELSKALDVTKSLVHKRGRVQRAVNIETKRAVEKTSEHVAKIASAIANEQVNKSTRRGWRQVPIRDPKTNRILEVRTEPLE